MNPQEELFVELLFHFDFDARKAYSRAGFQSKTKYAVNSAAYRLMKSPPIQAAIHRRRCALREKRAMTREEKLTILEGMIRNERFECGDRLHALHLHNRMVGETDAPATPGPREHERMTAAALCALSVPELIVKINRGLIAQAKGHVIDVASTVTHPGNGNGNGNGKTK